MKRVISIYVAFLVVLSVNIHAGGPPSEPMLRVNTEMHSDAIFRLDSDTGGRFVISCSADKTARLWDLKSGDLIKTFRPPIGSGHDGKLYSCALSPEAETVAVGNWTGYQSKYGGNFVFIFDTNTGQLIKRLPKVEDLPKDMEYSPDGNFLAVSLSGRGGVRVYETGSWTLVRSLNGYGDTADCLSFDRGGRLATVSWDGRVRLYDSEFNLTETAVLREGKRPNSIDFSPSGSIVAVGYYDCSNLDIVDGKDLSLLYELKNDGDTNGPINIRNVAWSHDGRYLYAASSNWLVKKDRWINHIRRIDIEGGRTYVDLPAALGEIYDLKVTNSGEVIFCGGFPELGIIDGSGLIRSHRKGQVIVLNARDREHLKVSPDALRIGFDSSERSSFTFSIEDRSLMQETSTDPSYTTTAAGLCITEWKNSHHPKLNGKELEFIAGKCQSVDIAPSGKHVVVGGWWLYCFEKDGTERWVVPAVDYCRSVNIADQREVCVVAYGDGILRWHRLTDGEILLSLLVHSDGGRWILWTPSGYYDASPGGEDLIGWHVNSGMDQSADFFPAGRFRDRYYRPDVIQLILEHLDEQTALAEANRARNIRSVYRQLEKSLPPVLAIRSPEYGARLSGDRAVIEVEVRTPTADPVVELKSLVNGRPTGDILRGLNIVSKEGMVKTLTVTLEGGVNFISIIGRNANGWSEPSGVKVICRRAFKEFTIKPKLYVLAIGVSEYRDRSLLLQYPSKDARDFTAVLSGQKGLLYRDVVTKLLVDDHATKDNILDGLDWIQSETTATDIAVIFIAGHGMNDNTGRLYFLPVDVDQERLKRSGLPADEFAETIRNIAGKILYFMDTCHSGNIKMGRRGPEVDLTAVVNELSSAETGAVVFCSSSGRQYSLESDKWENGAFTKAAVEGLMGNADYTADGKLTINELELYIAERVKDLTSGRQTPVTAKPATIRDFPIAVLE
jgi:WD40 repeat protein